MPRTRLEPKLIAVLREGISARQLLADLAAGLVVGIVALPLALAFAIASGVQPAQGLYTAIVAGFLMSMLSGSRVQIGGPTGAFVVIVSGIVGRYGYDGLATATFLAGIMLVLMGVGRLGAVIKYIPYPVTVGFTTGIALIIAVGQVRDFTGLAITTVPDGFVEKIAAFATRADTTNPWTLALSALTVGIVVLWPRVTHRIPGSLVALIVVTALMHGFDLPVETIASRFGEVPHSLPAPRLPLVTWELTRTMFGPALTIALLAGIESLLSAVVADGMTGRRHRSNMELVSVGIANLASPIFGGIPATGAIARTATNIKNGGRTPFAGMTHALVVLLILLFCGPWAGLIPLGALAGILMVVAWNMSEWRLFLRLFRGPKSDVAVLLVTFGLTVLVDLSVAIQIGVVLAALLFMRRMAEVTQVGNVTRLLEDEDEEEDATPIRTRVVPVGVEVFEIDGPFFFGAVERFKDAIADIEPRPRVLILRMRKVLSIDATGLTALDEARERTLREGGALILSGVHAQPLVALDRAGMLDRIGAANLAPGIDEALARARKLLESSAPASGTVGGPTDGVAPAARA